MQADRRREHLARAIDITADDLQRRPILGVIAWKDLLTETAAWDTLIWFGAIIGLAGGPTDMGFIKWMSSQISASFTRLYWLTAFVMLGLHYAFATASGHVAALYAPFAAAAIAAGASAPMVAICFGIFSNLMWGNTEYGGGPGRSISRRAISNGPAATPSISWW